MLNYRMNLTLVPLFAFMANKTIRSEISAKTADQKLLGEECIVFPDNEGHSFPNWTIGVAPPTFR